MIAYLSLKIFGPTFFLGLVCPNWRHTLRDAGVNFILGLAQVSYAHVQRLVSQLIRLWVVVERKVSNQDWPMFGSRLCNWHMVWPILLKIRKLWCQIWPVLDQELLKPTIPITYFLPGLLVLFGFVMVIDWFRLLMLLPVNARLFYFYQELGC